MRKTLLWSTVIALPLALAACDDVAAQEAAEACPGVQVGENGLIGLDEYTSYGDTLFDEWDDDESGTLSMDEFNDCLGAEAAEGLFADWDANDDQALSRDEFLTEAEFGNWDEDDDEELAEDEFLFDDFFI